MQIKNKIELKRQLESLGIKVQGNYVRKKDLTNFIVTESRKQIKKELRAYLIKKGARIQGNYVHKKDLEYILEAEISWQKIKNFFKSIAKKTISTLLALGILAGTAMGKDVSKTMQDYAKEENKLHMTHHTGVKVKCKTEDTGGKSYDVQCTWTDANNKSATLHWSHSGSNNSSSEDIDLDGDENSTANDYAKQFYNELKAKYFYHQN